MHRKQLSEKVDTYTEIEPRGGLRCPLSAVQPWTPPNWQGTTFHTNSRCTFCQLHRNTQVSGCAQCAVTLKAQSVQRQVSDSQSERTSRRSSMLTELALSTLASPAHLRLHEDCFLSGTHAARRTSPLENCPGAGFTGRLLKRP